MSEQTRRDEPGADQGPRLLIAQLDEADPIGPLGDWLVEAGASLKLWPAYEGSAPPDVAVDGLVVLGGRMGVHEAERHPGLAEVTAQLDRALRDCVPVLALCLGAQALAVAAGGEVARGDEGPEYGAQLVAKRQAAATDPLLREAPITPDVIQWHQDAVTRLPAGAILLASSPSYPVQAFRVGPVAWGFQFHIETTPQVVRAWAAADADALEAYDVEAILARSDAAHEDLRDTWAPVAAAFVQVARDPAAVAAPPRAVVSSAAPIMDPDQIRAALAAEAAAARGGPAPLPLPTLRPDAS